MRIAFVWRVRAQTSKHLVQTCSGYPLLALVLALTFFPSRSPACDKVIWQIGEPNHAALEFNRQWDFSQGRDPEFIVGQSSPGKDWSAFHPGPADAAHGRRVHPFTILFHLDDTPRGVFYLSIDTMFRVALIPEYFVEINGKKGRFYFRPVLTYDKGDPDVVELNSWSILSSAQHLRIALPAAYFQKGQNLLVLTCADGRSQVVVPQQKIQGRETSGIYYDALELSQDPEARLEKPALQATAQPTIFYRQHGGNELREVVVVKATAGGRSEHGTATLRLGKGSYSCQLPSGYDFGESECTVEVPELGGPTPARLAVNLGGRSNSTALQLVPQKKWKLFLCPHEHMDVGYHNYRSNTAETINRSIDEIIRTMESHPDYKYNIDHAFALEDYWEHRGEGWRERCLKVLREGRLTLPLLFASINSGLASQEELHRQAYFSAAFSRQYNLSSLTYANQTDVPAHSWALPSVLHSMGVKYLVIGSNSWRGPVIEHSQLNEKSPFWWEGPDGGKVLTWYSRVYGQFQWLFAQHGSVPAGVNSLPIFLQAYGSPAYAADAVMLYGTQGDMSPFAVDQVGFPDQWNKEFAYPKILVSTIPEFFQYMERNFASSFATLRGDGGAWWEEMAAADALTTGAYRKAKERVLAAEAAVSLGAIVSQDFRAPLQQDLEIWNNLLWYTEHSWGRSKAWRSPESDLTKELQRGKQSHVWRADLETHDMLHRGLSQLTDKIYARGETVVVFNSFSWARGGLVEVELGRGQGLIDSKDRQPVTLELVRRDPDESYDRLRFWVDEVPPLGYRCYEVTPSGSAVPATDLPVSNVLENEFYKVTVDPARGGIASILDKQLGQELVDASSPYAFDQYVYAGYAHEGASLIQQRTRFNSTLLQYGTALPRAELAVSVAERGKVVGVRRLPWGRILVLRSSAVHTPNIETEIRLFDKVKRIELVNTIEKEIVQAPEGVYIAFPFAARQPVVRYEIQNAWIDPMHDQLPGANKEWFAGQHWASVTSPEFSVGLGLDEAPLLTIGDINRGRWPKTMELHNGTVFSYIMDNYDGDDEQPFQGGVFTFHYAISSAAQFDPASLARFGRELATPLEIDEISSADRYFNRVAQYGSPPEPLHLPEAGFIKINTNDIVLSTWKAAEDDIGYILRFYNTTDRSVTARVGFPHLRFENVYCTNAVEVNQEPLVPREGEITLALKPHEIYSLRITGFRLE
jgi:alpha-mannosidase